MDRLNILVADDDPAILKLLCSNLKARGYEVTAVDSGDKALVVVEDKLVDLVILDIMMPKVNGIEVCRRIREWSQVPIIMLSACGEDSDKVQCLDLGADDYLMKPFSIAELVARVKTALRHSGTARVTGGPPALVSGEMEINFAQRRVTVRGSDLKLTPTEYILLQFLATHANKVITHTMLLQKVWGQQYYSERQYLHVFISRLRRKLEPDPENPRFIITVPGVGYCLSCPA
ncbi:MAG: response regulator transcription factor [Chloroflexi bacterium]|nr:response regulator transcription factor [Chloroflexota bacterium]